MDLHLGASLLPTFNIPLKSQQLKTNKMTSIFSQIHERQQKFRTIFNTNF